MPATAVKKAKPVVAKQVDLAGVVQKSELEKLAEEYAYNDANETEYKTQKGLVQERILLKLKGMNQTAYSLIRDGVKYTFEIKAKEFKLAVKKKGEKQTIKKGKD